ncbi:alanine racemase [Rhodobacteraceae bacterium LMO-12]|nr:alanine racemase [Rhodobacteraceae bacterium LMO-JJ12]
MASGILTIDLDALVTNWRSLAAMCDGETGAVVKADGYGLGAPKVARALARAGARRFFVAIAEEGGALREVLGPGPEINVMAGHMAGDTDMINDLSLTPMINSLDQLLRHVEALPGAPFGIQLDSGMNRLGMEPSEWQAVRDIAVSQGPTLLMSHLACADEPNNDMNRRQLTTFREMTDGLDIPRSLAATGGILLGREYHFDLTRPGIGLYGGNPFDLATPVVRLELPVIQIRNIDPGESVGYSNSFIAKTPTRVATVASGYADGLLRTLSGTGTLHYGDTPCPILGRISMDLITVDISALNETPTSLEIIGDAQRIDELARAAGTIGYEILTSLGPRYARRYFGG